MRAIVNADERWGIGKNNKLLVSIPQDMKFFRNETTGKVVIMGRKTLESFPGGRPLVNRVNIVLTKDPGYTVKGAVIVHSLEEALEKAKAYDPDCVYCIGGDSIYRQMLPYCDTVFATRCAFTYEADSFFPNLDEDPEWELVGSSEEQTYFDLEYRFTRYERRGKDK